MMTRLQRSILFPREFALPLEGAREGVDGLEELWLQTDQGPVEAWFLRAEADGPAPLVIFAHGNAELIDYWPRELDQYRRWGFNVLLPEYRGYGRSAGTPSQDAITRDFVAFYDLAMERPDVDPGCVLLHGRSLGGGAVAQLALLRPPDAMILQSTFTSVTAFARQFFVPGALVADPFDTLEVVRTLGKTPLLIFHGTFDTVIPLHHAEELRDSAQRARLVTYPCDHNDFPADRRKYWAEIRSFLDEVFE